MTKTLDEKPVFLLISIALLLMDLLSTDIISNVILPLMPKHALISLQRTSKRYHRLVLSCFPYELRMHLEILGEICEAGLVDLLRWFLGRGQSHLHWSLLISGVNKLLIIGKLL